MPTNTQQVTIPIENATLNYIIQHETRRFIDNLDPSNPPTPTEISFAHPRCKITCSTKSEPA